MIIWLILLIQLVLIFYTSKYIYNSLFSIFYKLSGSRGISEKFLFLIFFPGVIVHELAHMLVAEAMFVKVYKFDVSPKSETSGIRMGSVEIAATDPIRRAIIGFAPLIVGVGVITALLWFFKDEIGLSRAFSSWGNFGIHAVVIWAIFLIANTMFSSKKDLEGLLGLGIFFSFAALVISIMLVLIELNPLGLLIFALSRDSVVSLIEQLAILLLIPLVINILAFVIAGSVVKKLN